VSKQTDNAGSKRVRIYDLLVAGQVIALPVGECYGVEINKKVLFRYQVPRGFPSKRRLASTSAAYA
jgi:hypothetical protein